MKSFINGVLRATTTAVSGTVHRDTSALRFSDTFGTSGMMMTSALLDNVNLYSIALSDSGVMAPYLSR